MNHFYDLAIIGGGPAGASAAITAARQGASVVLFERGRYPRHKVCGEFVSPESITLLQWLLGAASDALFHQSLTLSETRLFLDGRTIRVPIAPAAASITRHDLDLALWSAAREAGATALEETVVQSITQIEAKEDNDVDAKDIGGENIDSRDAETKLLKDASMFCIRTSAGELQVRAVLNASGRWSNLSQSIPGSPSRSKSDGHHEVARRAPTRWLGLKAHFHAEMEPACDLYFFDGGYCGVQPIRCGNANLINVCALFQPGAIGPEKATDFASLFARHPVLAARSREWRPAFAPLSTFPVIFRDPRPTSAAIFNAGDAAGFVDPFVGDGISLALRGGNLAATHALSALAGNSSIHQALENYEQEYRRRLRPVYQASSLLRQALAVPRFLRTPVLLACEHSPRLAQYLMQATRSRT